MKEELLDRIKYKEAEKYASGLESTGQKAILNQTEIPGNISKCISTLTKYSAVPNATLAVDVSKENLANWLLNFLNNVNGNIYFKCNELYWKFWIKTSISDIVKFTKYLVQTEVNEFIIVNIETNDIICLLSEEYEYLLFIRNADMC